MTEPCIDHGYAGNRRGYSSCWFQGRYVSRHVRALIIKTGEQPNGRVARHTCDNSRCINPQHLVWGTQAENVRDTAGKPGSKVSTRVLTDQEVTQIRSEFTGEYGQQAALALAYGVPRNVIHQIVRNKRR